MRHPPRICFIGGGSYQWARTLVRDIAVQPALAGCHVVLEDIDPAPLEVMLPLAERIAAAAGTGMTVSATTSLEEGLEGADYVILSITTGGLEAMRRDVEIPKRYGIYQPVGDTVGPGGLARSWRNIPVVVEIARTIERICPDAWLINVTNPMTTLCRAVTKATRVRTIGLCHELVGALRTFVGPLLGVDDISRFHSQVAGVNHLPWLLSLYLDGRDVLPDLTRIVAEGGVERLQLDTSRAANFGAHRLKAYLLETFGALPAAGDRHVAEFFPQFLQPETPWGPFSGIHLTTIEDRYEWLAGWKARAQRWLSGEEPIDLMPSSEGTARVIAALHSGQSHVEVMNLPNTGQVPDLPLGAVLETMGLVDGAGARPFAVGPLPPGIDAIVRRHVANQEMIVDASLRGDRQLLLQVLINDPLTATLHDPSAMLDELLAPQPAVV